MGFSGGAVCVWKKIHFRVLDFWGENFGLDVVVVVVVVFFFFCLGVLCFRFVIL